MKTLITFVFLWCVVFTSKAQSLDFQNSIYFTESNGVLTSSGLTLATFNFNNSNFGHPLLGNGIFFPVQDSVGSNLWIRVRHIAADPNGANVGVNVPYTSGSPFRSSGFGGWSGFLYQFDIYQDANATGNLANRLNGLVNTKITVESIETLSSGELVIFQLLNDGASDWQLNSINFTGLNPTSNPGFNNEGRVWNSGFPPFGFSTVFLGGKNMNVVDMGSGSYYAEFRMSATNVSQFRYGYEYTGLTAGYQGMRLYFGRPFPLPLTILEFNGKQIGAGIRLDWLIADAVNVDHFEVEQSVNGLEFTRLGSIPFDLSATKYNFAYQKVSAGINFYRIKVVDKDGKLTISRVIKLNAAVRKRPLEVYPNPSTDYLTMICAQQDELSMYDASGKLIKTARLQRGSNLINIQQLPAGIYFISNNKGESTRFIKAVK